MVRLWVRCTNRGHDHGGSFGGFPGMRGFGDFGSGFPGIGGHKQRQQQKMNRALIQPQWQRCV